jgi:uncharacterized protein (TIGR03437 family)
MRKHARTRKKKTVLASKESEAKLCGPASRSAASQLLFVQVLFAGMAPGFVGLVQVNFQVPDLPAGDYPIQVSIGSAQSNAPAMTVGR